jgi:alpha-amylase
MFASVTPDYLDDDLLGTTRTHAMANFETGHPLYQAIGGLARLTQRHDALRDGAQIHRFSSPGAGVYAFSRLDRRHPHEYVVALNNSESTQTVSVPTYMSRDWFDRVYGTGARELRSDSAGRLRVTVPALSAVVYRAEDHVPRSKRAPDISLDVPSSARDRAEIGADVRGSSFYEVTFYARKGRGGWRAIGTDDNAPYRVFHDIADEQPGRRIEYKAVVLDNARHTRTSRTDSLRVANKAITITTPAEGANVRTSVLVSADVVPEHSDDVVVIERRIGSGPWTRIATDDSSPVYSTVDDISSVTTATTVSYRMILNDTVISAVRTVNVVPQVRTTATIHYRRPAGDYADWGLHLWGDAIADGVATDWFAPRPPTRIENGEAIFEIPLKDDTKPVNFIVHKPGGDSVPDTREPGGDRSFVPLDHQEIWLRQGDPAIYFSPPG